MTTSDIEQALVDAVKTAIPELRTTDTYEANYDSTTQDEIIANEPFCLIQYAAGDPKESERGAGGESGLKVKRFQFFIGSRNLRSRRESQVGCYSVLEKLEALLDGKTVSLDGVPTAEFAWQGETFVQRQKNGTLVYAAEYSLNDF